MNANAVVLVGVAALSLSLTSATAGPCTTEIDSLTKVLAARDAGSGPSPGATDGTQSAAPPSGQHPPTAAMSQESRGTATSAEDVRRQAAGQPTAAQQGRVDAGGQHPPTAAMTQATQSQTAPATTGQHPPTAAMSEAARTQAAPPSSASPQNPQEASLALNRARTLDQQGQEAECMDAVRQAKQLVGSK